MSQASQCSASINTILAVRGWSTTKTLIIYCKIHLMIMPFVMTHFPQNIIVLVYLLYKRIWYFGRIVYKSEKAIIVKDFETNSPY